MKRLVFCFLLFCPCVIQASLTQEEFSRILSKSAHSTSRATPEEGEGLFVFLSFSVPDRVWIETSKFMEKTGGTILIRGLPQNSFVQLSKKIQQMGRRGVQAPIQIHPKMFQKHNVEEVPVFLITEGEKQDRLAGNVSLGFALDTMAGKGETDLAKKLKGRLYAQNL